MRTRAARILAVLVLGSTSLIGCLLGSDSDPGINCTAMACEDGLSIAFASSVTATGKYDFELVADGHSITCETTLPLAPCGGSAQPKCSAEGVGVIESGCALSPAEQSLEGISLNGMHPSSVAVTVKRDGAEVAKQTFTLSYQRLAPNGEECGPVCMQASQTLAVK